MSTAIPLITKLSSRVLRVLGCNPGPMTLQGTNSYIIGTGKRRILLDTSESNKPDYILALESVLQEHEVKIEKVLLSHWHYDHVGSAASVAANPGIASEECSFHKFPRTDVEASENYGVTCVKLSDGERIQTEGATIKVIHTPGHTVDHAAFWLEEERALFTGDCVLGEGTTVLETLSDYMRSLHLLLALDAADAKSHISGYIAHREQREKQILECLKQQGDASFVTDEFIVRKVYKGLPEQLIPAATLNVSHHLTKLLEEGQVEQNVENAWRIASKNGKL
ncbi:hypothetical protein B566_EDAN004417 [Ephemera danica]|nr:hypothetical protein B566_EDAN004417 [Ephemera danica]